MRVAIVHDWLVSYRGGEKVLETIASEFPEAPVYTLFYDPGSLPESLKNRVVYYPPLLNRLKKIRKILLPFLPACIEAFNLNDYDLIISTSSCVAKGVIPAPQARHLCYIHSPMRYIWDQKSEYLKQMQGIPFASLLFHLLGSRLRIWDQVSSHRVDQFIANSAFVAKRVKKYYGADSQVIHPPVDTEFFHPPENPDSHSRNYFLAAGALVSYKGFGRVIHACEQAGQQLIIAGAGPELKRLQKISGKHTQFIVSPDNESLRKLFQGAKALLFPGVEDFGMVAIEAMACGTPVIALRQGGSLDFIEEGLSGEFVDTTEIPDWVQALRNFGPEKYDASTIRKFSETFHHHIFIKKFRESVQQLLSEKV
ncbi:MAG: glycosyltransferase [Deltaproteobacteria bacterium]|nr:glycosyltransferase [Deltaproteobacteria bacterium]